MKKKALTIATIYAISVILFLSSKTLVTGGSFTTIDYQKINEDLAKEQKKEPYKIPI